MKATTIHSWADLREFGINCLTGEACAYGQRLLCDLSEEGKTLICEYFGLPHNIPLHGNWNSVVVDVPAVASVMLPRSALKDLALFALFHKCGYMHAVVTVDGSIHGYSADFFESSGLTVAEARERMQGQWYTNVAQASAASIGGRNVHAFTGRTV